MTGWFVKPRVKYHQSGKVEMVFVFDMTPGHAFPRFDPPGYERKPLPPTMKQKLVAYINNA